MSDALERTLPHNLEAERSVLGAVLVNNDAFDRLDGLTDAHFYRDAHRKIYNAIKALIDRRIAVDSLTLKEELERVGLLEAVGGPAYVASLSDGVPRSTNISYYASIVKEKATLRGVIFAANKTLAAAYEAERPALTILLEADRAFVDLQQRSTNRLTYVGESIGALMQSLEYRVAHKGELTGADTGYGNINELTMGWQPGELIIGGARPSIGKSTFALNTAVAVAKAGKRVALFSLEMKRRQLDYRLLASLSGVMLTRLAGGFIGAAEYGRISEALEVLRDLPLAIDDQAGVNVWDVRAKCRRMRADVGLDLVIVDYIQLMAGSLDRRGANRNDEIDDTAVRLKTMADELSVPVIVLSQLNRGSEKRPDPRPKLSDLRESGALEQHADTVWFLHRKNHREGGTTNFILEKQRNGPTGTVNLTLDRDTTTFTEGGEEPPEPPRDERRPSTRKGQRRRADALPLPDAHS